MNQALAVVSMLVLVVCNCAMSGCQGGNVGGRKHPVVVSTEPPGATTFLVRWDDWLKAGRSLEALDDEGFRRAHRITESATPVTLRAPAYSYVIIVEREGMREVSERFTPGDVQSVHVTIGEP